MSKRLTFRPVGQMDRASLIEEVVESRNALEKIRKLIRRDIDFNKRLMKSLKLQGKETLPTYEGAYRAELALRSVKNHVPLRSK